MNRLILILLVSVSMAACDAATMQRVLDGASSLVELSDGDIANGLKEALNVGVDDAVKKLAKENGFYSSVYKILLPAEAQAVADKLKIIPGFGDLEEKMIKKINQAAEDAAGKATPIFVNAIKSMTINDAMDILMGNKDAATKYLHKNTYNGLYGEFKPVLENSLNKFGALDLWTNAITKYNSLPLVNDINPDLSDHINTKALGGLFTLIEKKELGIRSDISQRTSDLLKRVFEKQD